MRALTSLPPGRRTKSKSRRRHGLAWGSNVAQSFFAVQHGHEGGEAAVHRATERKHKIIDAKKLLFSQFHAKILQAYVENHDAMQFYCHQP